MRSLGGASTTILRPSWIRSEGRVGVGVFALWVEVGRLPRATFRIIESMPSLHSLAVGVFAGASGVAALRGFALQKAFSNIVSGVFNVIFKPFLGDDIIKIQGATGTIEGITSRHTVIRALENKRLIYPNMVIDSEPIINWTIKDARAQKFIFISIVFEADLKRAVEIIGKEATKHPELRDERTPGDIAAGGPLVEVPVIDWAGAVVSFHVPRWAKDLPTAMADDVGWAAGGPTSFRRRGHREGPVCADQFSLRRSEDRV